MKTLATPEKEKPRHSDTLVLAATVSGGRQHDSRLALFIRVRGMGEDPYSQDWPKTVIQRPTLP